MILVIGDLHFRDRLSYSDHVDRTKERDEVLDFIVDQAKDCDIVVSLGDVFDRRDPPATVTRDAARFFERFKDKRLFIISGNHDKKASGGTTALDFLREIGNKHWEIFTQPHNVKISEKLALAFLPHMYKGELEVENDEEGAKKLVGMLNKFPADILFHHHAVSDTLAGQTSTNLFKEIILPKKEVEKNHKLVIGGHIHSPGVYGKTIVTGSVFNCDVGETGKFLWKIDTDDFTVKQIRLPGREIHKLVLQERFFKLNGLPISSIVKCIVTNNKLDVEKLKKELEVFDASLIIEQYPEERERVHFEDGALDLDVVNLLNVYAEARKIDINMLTKGYDLIK